MESVQKNSVILGCNQSYLPSWSFRHCLVTAVVSSVGEELARQFVRILVHAVNSEPDLVHPLDLAGWPPPLHEADDGATQPLWIVRVW